MSYRIENGQVTMPVSELNRVNDLVKKLEGQRYSFCVSERQVYPWNTIRTWEYKPESEGAVKLVDEIKKDIMASEIEDSENEIITVQYMELDRIKRMTTREFRKSKRRGWKCEIQYP